MLALLATPVSCSNPFLCSLHSSLLTTLVAVYSILRHTQLLPTGKDEEGRFKRMGRIYGDMLGRWGELEEMTICGKHVETTTLIKEEVWR